MVLAYFNVEKTGYTHVSMTLTVAGTLYAVETPLCHTSPQKTMPVLFICSMYTALEAYVNATDGCSELSWLLVCSLVKYISLSK